MSPRFYSFTLSRQKKNGEIFEKIWFSFLAPTISCHDSPDSNLVVAQLNSLASLQNEQGYMAFLCPNAFGKNGLGF